MEIYKNVNNFLFDFSVVILIVGILGEKYIGII